jgi:hypothetical protein
MQKKTVQYKAMICNIVTCCAQSDIAPYADLITCSSSPLFLSQVDARQYPVTVHFSKRTEVAHYLNETFKKICQIHRRLPDGG